MKSPPNIFHLTAMSMLSAGPASVMPVLSGAAKSGLKAGDVVQKINKQTTKAIAGLENI